MDYSVQTLFPRDEPVLWRMLYEAAHLADEGYTSPDAARQIPDLTKYARHWGKPDDLGFAAYDLASRKPIGAAWVRLLTGLDQGYAYLDASTPELAIGVIPEYRNQGIGTQLLTALIQSAQERFARISLSVRASNPAQRLYQRVGFEPVAGSERDNRAGGRSCTMQLVLKRNV